MQVLISISEQSLTVNQQGAVLFQAQVSTAKEGAGEALQSNKTPRGRHYIRAKVGVGQPVDTVFVGRRPTGEIYTPELAKRFPDRDWILTRILWLCGQEVGKNRLGEVDTMRRYIYIHGTPKAYPMGTPLSHGCIRMHNEALLTVFDLVPAYTPVLIKE